MAMTDQSVTPRARWLRFSLFSLLATMTIVAVGIGSFVLTERDLTHQTRLVVAWVVEGEGIPGCEEDYPDWEHMRDVKEFIVVCDYLPSDSVISSDPRVRRISREEYDSMPSPGLDYHGIDYLIIELKDRNMMSATLDLSNQFGGLAGHGYDVFCRKWMFWLSTQLEMTWVS
jgi:hypothetical protein